MLLKWVIECISALIGQAAAYIDKSSAPKLKSFSTKVCIH